MTHIRRHLITLLALSFAFSASPLRAIEKGEVTLPIEEYQKLIELRKKPAVTSLDTVILSGELKNKRLALEIRGQSSRKAEAKTWLQAPSSARLVNCQGNGMVYRVDSGYSLLPQGPQIQIRCHLRFSGQERLELKFGSAVLDVQTRIKDAEVQERIERDGTFKLTLQRKLKVLAPDEAGAPVVAYPRYQIRVESDQIRFQYRVRFENPSRLRRKLELVLPNREQISQIKTGIPYQAKGNKLNLTLPPRKSNLTIHGQIPGKRFLPLFDKEEQYLLLEVHPLVNLKLVKSPPRIGLEQTGLQPKYETAMGFLMRKGTEVAWESKTREVFASESFATVDGRYLVYLPEKGRNIVDTTWNLRNQGNPSLNFKLPGKALFASAEGRPQVLAKTEEDELFLPLRTGASRLRLQYALEESPPTFAGLWRTVLVRPETALPTTQVEVRTTASHKILAARFGDDLKVPGFRFSNLVWALLLALAWFYLVRRLDVLSPSGIALSSGGLFLVTSICSCYRTYAVLILLVGIIIRNRQAIWNWIAAWNEKTRPVYKILIGLFVLFLAIPLFLFLGTRSSRHYEPTAYDSAQMAGDLYDKVEVKRRGKALMAKSQLGAGADLEEAMAPSSVAEEREEDSYMGLPVEQVIPMTPYRMHLSTLSVAEEEPLKLSLLFLSRWAATLLWGLLVLAWLAPLAARWKGLAQAIRLRS